MIPSIKESNQLKAFLGFKEHYPEFYNTSMDNIQDSFIDQKQFFSVNLKDFATKMPEALGERKTGALNKFITGRKTLQPEVIVSEEIESPRKNVPSTIKSKSNMRYHINNENLDMESYSPEIVEQRKFVTQTEKKMISPTVDYTPSARIRGSTNQINQFIKNADMPRLSSRTQVTSNFPATRGSHVQQRILKEEHNLDKTNTNPMVTTRTHNADVSVTQGLQSNKGF